MESGQHDSLNGQTKFLSDRYKLARGLKDMIDYIYASLPSRHKERIKDIEVFGFLTSGLEGTVYVMSLPYSGVYKFTKLFQFELPQTASGIGYLVKAVVRLLIVKQRVRAVIDLLKGVSQVTSQDVLSGRSVWSPVAKRKILIRETPTTPTRKHKKSSPKYDSDNESD
jgi:hypothetical protein